jgi:hypothetical protein
MWEMKMDAGDFFFIHISYFSYFLTPQQNNSQLSYMLYNYLAVGFQLFFFFLKKKKKKKKKKKNY